MPFDPLNWAARNADSGEPPRDAGRDEYPPDQRGATWAEAHAGNGNGRPTSARAEKNGHAPNRHAGARSQSNEPLEIALPEPEKFPDPMRDAAYHGLLGELVRAIEANTEADPAAILVQILVMFGNCIGRSAFWQTDADRHYGNLFVGLVGQSSRARKGTSTGRALACFEHLEDGWARNCLGSGLSSGEGLIWAVRDPIFSTHLVKQRGRVVDRQQVETDPGVADKRLLVIESEFARPLTASQRKGNTLSAIIRELFDSGTARSLTKNSPARCTNAHVSIIGHITRVELLRCMAAVEAFNGFANRFLWLAVRRARELPLGGPPVHFGNRSHKLALLAQNARGLGPIGLDDEAKQFWCASAYHRLTETGEGRLASILDRGAPLVRRLAMLYALLDGQSDVGLAHLHAALALWEYSVQSVRWIFGGGGDETGNRDADAILMALRSGDAQSGLSQTEIHVQVFNKHRGPTAIAKALGVLRDRSLIYETREAPNGRTVTKYHAAKT